MQRISAAVTALILGCGGGSSVQKTAASAPQPEAPESDAPAEELSPAERAQASLARLPQLTAQLAKLRGKEMTVVPASLQSEADFRAFAIGEAAKEMPPERGAAIGRALAQLGLLAEAVQLDQVLVDAAVSQAAAYYDPAQAAFFVVKLPNSDAEFDVVATHELAHALQDQVFDLEAYVPSTLDDDAATARRFVVEGEATLLMMMAPLAATGLDATAMLPMLRPALAQFATLDPEDLAKLSASDPAAAQALASLPPYVITPMLDSYFGGADAVATVLAAGGWAAVDALYATPPASTEQVLHPAEKLACGREAPVPQAVPDTAAGKGWTSIHDGVVGELGVRIWGRVQGATDPMQVAAGWGGDAYRVFERGDERLALWATTWDTAVDAEQFAAAATAMMAARGGKGQVRAKGLRVDVALGCAGKACKAPLDAVGKAQPKRRGGGGAPDAACLAKLAPPAAGAGGVTAPTPTP